MIDGEVPSLSIGSKDIARTHQDDIKEEIIPSIAHSAGESVLRLFEAVGRVKGTRRIGY